MTLPAFSVLLPVYAGDSAPHFERAFASATVEQTLRPAEVVVVRDGPVGPELAVLLDEIRSSSAVPVVLVELERNLGLARALSVGLEHCANEIVARTDADDICRPDRFARQVPCWRAASTSWAPPSRSSTTRSGPGWSEPHR
ncbi:glycosyltransferase [Oerskovia sp. M15]